MLSTCALPVMCSATEAKTCSSSDVYCTAANKAAGVCNCPNVAATVVTETADGSACTITGQTNPTNCTKRLVANGGGSACSHATTGNCSASDATECTIKTAAVPTNLAYSLGTNGKTPTATGLAAGYDKCYAANERPAACSSATDLAVLGYPSGNL